MAAPEDIPERAQRLVDCILAAPAETLVGLIAGARLGRHLAMDNGDLATASVSDALEQFAVGVVALRLSLEVTHD
jgi:hypothetical protein